MAHDDQEGGNDAECAVDRVLASLVVGGDRESLGTLYDRHAQRLLACAIAVLGNTREAEDLVHDVFVELWQNPSRYDPKKGALAYWLQMRVRCRAIDRHRALAVRLRYEQSKLDTVELGEFFKDCEAETLLALDSLTFISKSQREVLRLLYWKGYSCQEIADLLDIPLGTVKSRLSSALRKLRGRFRSSDDYVKSSRGNLARARQASPRQNARTENAPQSYCSRHSAGSACSDTTG